MFARIAITIGLLVAVPAFAEDQVHAPDAERGTRIEQTGKPHDQTVSIGHGITSWWSSEIEAEKERSASSLDFENIFSFSGCADSDFDGDCEHQPFSSGAIIEAEHPFKGPDDVVFGPIVAFDTGSLRHTINFTVEKEFGRDHDNDWAPKISYQLLWYYSDLISPGLEYYGAAEDLQHLGRYEDQSHITGPVVVGHYGALTYRLGVMFGLTAASRDVTPLWRLEWAF